MIRTSFVFAMLSLAACRGDHINIDESSSSTGSTTEGAATTTADTTTTDAVDTTTEGSAPTDPSTSSSGGDDPKACSLGSPCDDGTFCVAPYSDNIRGDFVCTNECIDDHDETKWCFIVESCCSANAVCTTRGYCESPTSDPDSSSGGDSTGADSSG